jgi:hypothetical protein
MSNKFIKRQKEAKSCSGTYQGASALFSIFQTKIGSLEYFYLLPLFLSYCILDT